MVEVEFEESGRFSMVSHWKCTKRNAVIAPAEKQR